MQRTITILIAISILLVCAGCGDGGSSHALSDQS